MDIHEQISKQLKEGEELVRVVRRHPAVLIMPVVASGLLLLIDFFLMAWWFDKGWWGLCLWLLILVLSGWWIFRTIYMWSLNVLVLTNQRVIDVNQRGVFDRRVSEAPYEKIQDVHYIVKGVWQTMLSFGSIVLQTAGNTTNLELTNVRRPVELQQLITDLMSHQGNAKVGPNLTAEELLKIVERLKAELGPDRVAKLLNNKQNHVGETIVKPKIQLSQ